VAIIGGLVNPIFSFSYLQILENNHNEKRIKLSNTSNHIFSLTHPYHLENIKLTDNDIYATFRCIIPSSENVFLLSMIWNTKNKSLFV